ncbi:MAG: glutathione S-transferase family protein [Granulosicoccus sp.]
MGLLQDGKWVDRWYDNKSSKGRFVRSDAVFRSWITADGSPGPSGEGGFRAEANRYHLYISHACPWAHRTMIFRSLKGLQKMLPISVVHWFMGADGWTFQTADGVIADSVNGSQYMHQIYTKAVANFSGRVTVPVLWDKRSESIVSNESSEINRMFNSAFDAIGAKPGDYYPAKLRSEIDSINSRIYDTLNNGVYRAGFATSQQAYDEAITPLFETLDWLDNTLSTNRFVTGTTLTEADWRLFTTLIRFDPIYFSHFKCSKKRIADYANLSRYLKQLIEWPGIRETINMEHARKHYFTSHVSINPSGILPISAETDVDLKSTPAHHYSV